MIAELKISVVQCGLPHLEELAKRFDEYRQFYGKESDIDSARIFLRKRLANDESIIYAGMVCENKINYLAGFVQLYPLFSSVQLKKFWLLNDLYVMGKFRKLGLGKALINKAKELMDETNSYGFYLETAKNNNIARSLYEKAGMTADEKNIFYLYERCR
jgi:ribosomal protein S18 acetylase RimI-like enzyme